MAASMSASSCAGDTTVTVIELATGEILSTHLIEPTKSYWRNQKQTPGPMARAFLTVT